MSILDGLNLTGRVAVVTGAGRGPGPAMELMGARTSQRMAAERDCIARQAPVVTEFYTMAKEKGLKAALEWRDSRFGDGRATARGAE
jgi:enoyl-CoA hydratase